MDLLKKATSRKVAIEPGEESLHTEYDLKNADKTIKVIIGIDGGSTQTRSVVIDASEMEEIGPELLEPVYVIPSSSKTVPDGRKIEPKSTVLYDNMDSIITNTSSNVGDSLVSKVRLVRGTKAVDIEEKENRLKSTTQKSKDSTFYYNLLDNMAYAICQKYSGAIPTKVEVFLAASLPPDDINDKNIADMRKNLESYRWQHVSGVSIDFTFKSVITMTEPEAAIKAFYALSGEELPEATLHIEGGGRSIGVEILLGGDSLSSAQKTLEYGGKQLAQSLNDLYVAEYGGSGLSNQVLEKALRTGKVKDGNDLIDVMHLIAKIDQTFALKIVDDIIDKVFDTQTQVGIRQLNKISVSGRLMSRTMRPAPQEGELPDAEDQYSKGVSIADSLKTRFAELTPKTEFVHIEGNYIPAGLALEGIINFTDDAEVDSSGSGAVEAAATSEQVDDIVIGEELPLN